MRALIAKELVERHGLSRIAAARRMNLTPAAITQYLKEARGGKAVQLLKRSKAVCEIVSDIADHLAKEEASVYDVLESMCRACWALRREGLLCGLHKEILPSLSESKGECRCLAILSKLFEEEKEAGSGR